MGTCCSRLLWDPKSKIHFICCFCISIIFKNYQQYFLTYCTGESQLKSFPCNFDMKMTKFDMKMTKFDMKMTKLGCSLQVIPLPSLPLCQYIFKNKKQKHGSCYTVYRETFSFRLMLACSFFLEPKK